MAVYSCHQFKSVLALKVAPSSINTSPVRSKRTPTFWAEPAAELCSERIVIGDSSTCECNSCITGNIGITIIQLDIEANGGAEVTRFSREKNEPDPAQPFGSLILNQLHKRHLPLHL